MVKKTGKRASRPTILAIDVGGSRVKFMTDKERTKRAFASGPDLSAKAMVRQVKALTKDWSYDVISIGYPGPVINNRPLSEPHNLGLGMGRVQFRKGLRPPDEGRQRCADAGDRQLPGRPDAVPGPGNGSWLRDDRGWHPGADGARPPAVPQRQDVRAMRRRRSPQARWQEEMATRGR